MRRTLSVFRSVLRNRDIRRVEVAFAAFQAAEYGVWIAMLVYAFDRGGTSTAAIVAVAQLVPAALFAPVGGALGDRHPPARVLTAGYVVQAVFLPAVAVTLFAEGPALLAYAGAAVVSVATTLTRPTQAVLLPALARTPDELTAANVVTGWVEAGMALAGPGAAAVLLAVGSPAVVFAVFAAALAVAVILMSPLARRRTGAERGAGDGAAALAADKTVPAQVAAGFQALAEHAPVRVVVLLLGVAYLTWGAFDVLAVVLSIEVLGLGDSGVGSVNAAFGAGGLLGVTGAMALVGRQRLMPAILSAAALWGCAFALVGTTASVAVVVVLLVLAGVGQGLLEVAGRTLLQRISPPDVLARVFGIYEGLTMAMLALGALIVPPLVGAGGPGLAFAVSGLILPGCAVLLLRSLLAVDSAAHVPIVEISLLRGMRIFAPLPAPALEGVAHSLEPVWAAAGATIITQGDPGDRYYAIADGTVEAAIDGNPVATLARGDGFGEVALLRPVPRMATVTAMTDALLYALDREPFLIALTGHLPAGEAAEAVVLERAGQ